MVRFRDLGIGLVLGVLYSFVLSGPAWAQDAAEAASLAADGASPAAEAVTTGGTVAIVLMIVGLLWKVAIPAGFAWLVKKHADTEAKKEALRALEAGVDLAWINYVKVAKKDGLFSGSEARATAIQGAKNIAKGAGKKLLKAWGDNALKALVHKIANRKAGKA